MTQEEAITRARIYITQLSWWEFIRDDCHWRRRVDGVRWHDADHRIPNKWSVSLGIDSLDKPSMVIDSDLIVLVDPATNVVETLDEYLEEARRKRIASEAAADRQRVS